MIAITAVRAICAPKVGPIEFAEKSAGATPNFLSSAVLDLVDLARLELLRRRSGRRCLPSSRVVDLLDLRVAVAERRERVAHLVARWPRCCSGVVIRVPDSKSMPKLIPRPAIASAPAARIAPDIEKNHFDLPMKSKCQRDALLARAPSAWRERRMRARAIEPRIAEVASTAVNSDTSVPTPQREREALDARRGEREQDERDADRDDVRVDDRPQRLARSRRRSRAGSICPPRTSSFIRSKMTMFASAATAKREDQARDARQRERDRDQLDEREQEHRVDHQPERRHQAEHPVEDSRKSSVSIETDGAGDQALVERLLAERRGDLGLRDQLEVDRQRADAQVLRQVVGLLELADVVDLRARAAVDALRVLRKSIVASETIWLSSVIAKRWKRLAAACRRADDLLGAALGDRAW